MRPKRIKILGVPIDCVNMEQSLDAVDRMVRGDHAQTVIAINPEKVIKAQNDPVFLQWLNKAGLLIPDGIGVVVAVRQLMGENIARVPGAELMPEICRQSLDKGYKLYLLGASREVNDKAVKVLKEQYQGIKIVGNRDGYFDENDMPEIIEEINTTHTDILFVALGSPRQELWMEKYLPQTNIKVCQGVGGTFDVLAGNVKRAPILFRKIHLEWFYRLISQPGRLFRQTALPKFAYQVLKTRIIGMKN